jgi:hypothetical protein
MAAAQSMRHIISEDFDIMDLEELEAIPEAE